MSEAKTMPTGLQCDSRDCRSPEQIRQRMVVGGLCSCDPVALAAAHLRAARKSLTGRTDWPAPPEALAGEVLALEVDLQTVADERRAAWDAEREAAWAEFERRGREAGQV
jgi:hypothetical protein